MSQANHSSIPSSSLPLDDPLRKRARPRRLIDTHTLRLVEFPDDESVPCYSILSHRWEDQELSYREMLDLSTDETHPSRTKSGFQKIANACVQALNDGHSYIWVDTCCIDEGNHGQKSQDINSMYEYYSNAEVCYIFLNDFRPWLRSTASQNNRRPYILEEKPDHISDSIWFTRGWTLQEFIAPSSIKFFTADWEYYLIQSYDPVPWGIIASKTGIPTEILSEGRRGSLIRDVGIKERMTWSINRQTTKEEDQAYCLLGLLGVTMEVQYGEGAESAFERLARVLHQQYPDQMKEFVGNDGDGKSIMNLLRNYNKRTCDTARTEWMRVDGNLDLARAETRCQNNPRFKERARLEKLVRGSLRKM